KFPFAFEKTKHPKKLFLLLLLYPFFVAPTVPGKVQLSGFLLIATLIVILGIIVLKKLGSAKDVRLSKSSQIVLGVVFAAFYVLGFLTFKSFGRESVLIPSLTPFLVSFIIVGGIVYLIRK